ncbi:sulfatase family protein [Novipirellula artificiosorum]|uniref:Arylsulfatase n=1 Tax=Novipirellula artificiosorum TaxID=2528016 RepID=A0A5C6DT93_9BACT|nr:sulfatase [Novipirellula artificiosorum]TWU40533.1 Arylsulfatase [Novipirellula artificiosorum]
MTRYYNRGLLLLLAGCFCFGDSAGAVSRDNSGGNRLRPNLVVYLADDLSAADLPVYGGTSIQTPAIDDLASVGMTFDLAFVASPSCAPSRAALLTGLMPAQNGAEENHSYPRSGVLRLPQLLKELGYQTAAFGKVAHGKSAVDYGFDVIDLQKELPSLRKNVRQFLDDRTDTRPLALFVGTANPHVPWPSESTILPDKITLPPTLLDTPRTRVQRSRYLQEVKDLDAYLAELRELTQEHLGEEAIFVFSSDHGAQFPFGKWCLYDEGIHVPLIVSHPGQIELGSRTSAMVNWVDLLVTVIDLAGGKVPAEIDGRSFLSVLRGETTSHRERIFATHSGDRKMNVYPSRCIRTSQFKLIYNPHPEFAFTTHIDLLLRETSGDYFKQWQELAKSDPKAAAVVAKYHARPEVELYDLLADPFEQVNLASDPHFTSVKQNLLAELRQWMKSQSDEVTVFHEPLMLDAPETWLPRN